MKALFNLNQDLQRISASIDRGFEAAHHDRHALRKLMQQEFQVLKLEFGKGAVAAQADQEVLSVQEIYADANAYQQDAMKWISARKTKFAGQRLRSAYELVREGLKREPDSTMLLVTLGYLEKSQAQVQQIVGDPRAAAAHLAEAGKVFAKVIQAESSNVSALNGMANIYLFAEDYDRAIAIGEWLFAVDPHYGAAIWDLALALEKRCDLTGDPDVKEQLVTVYRHLLGLMPKQPQTFPANYLRHVQNRLEVLGAAPCDDKGEARK